MRVHKLDKARVEDFVFYCKKHRKDVDDSFLYDEDLKEFNPDDENPTYIVTDLQERVVAAASLVIDDYMKRGRKARFRIFHSEIDDKDIYLQMLDALLEDVKHIQEVDKVFVFIPVINENMIEILKNFGFYVDRYSFLLVREDLEIPDYKLNEGYELKAFRPGLDESAWCEVRNEAFARLKGNETPATPEMIKKMVASDDYLEDGMIMMYYEGRPVGVVRGAKDELEDSPIMNIGPLAIIPEHQGKGLGRVLLRASLKFAKEMGYNRTILCVNGENERAKALYLQEGFKQEEAVVCMEKVLR